MAKTRSVTGSEWWLHLTFDPVLMKAAWARPRPLRPRPTRDQYQRALAELDPTPTELHMLRFHAAAPNRSVTMRAVARVVLSKDLPASANLAYGRLARRLTGALGFAPDTRENGSPIWLSVIGEGWQPESGEYEWVMIPALASVAT